MQQRIGPENPGLSRFLAARLLLLVMLGFYLGGAVLAVMFYGFGVNPLKCLRSGDLGGAAPASARVSGATRDRRAARSPPAADRPPGANPDGPWRRGRRRCCSSRP